MPPRTRGQDPSWSNKSQSDYTRDGAATAKRNSKRKGMTDETTATCTGSPKRVATGSTKNNDTRSSAPNSDRLSSLSAEILDIIAHCIDDTRTMSAMSRISKLFYSLIVPRLYERVAVAAMFHAHIPKVIRTLEPHLTITQKKQLKREGRYKGQQERYPTGLDEEKVPFCASHVRQFIIGASDPGKRHKYIVERYYEEALKNMTNIEILETHVVTSAISQNVASLRELKALSLNASDASSEDISPIAHIEGLKHLNLQLGWGGGPNIGQRLIRNSMSTLRTLAIASNSSYYHCFQNWDQIAGPSGPHDSDSGSRFSHLHSLQMTHLLIDEEFIKIFQRVIDFAKLRELDIGFLVDDHVVFWPFLTGLVASFKSKNVDLHLRVFSTDMRDERHSYTSDQRAARVAVKSAFIASFDTLTTLELRNYGQFDPKQIPINPGLSDNLLQAILHHQNLTTLRMSYVGVISGLEIPYLSATTVSKIIDGLPVLRHFEFAPDETQIDAISKALCRGKNLESVKCFPHASWHAYPRPDPPGENIVTSILSTFMADADVDDGQEFVWENCCRLKQLDLEYRKWDIASSFPKPKKGQVKPQTVQIHVADKVREVSYQVVPPIKYIHVGYDPTLAWVNKVEKDPD